MAGSGDYVRAARCGARIGQAELAEQLDMSEITYQRREDDQHHSAFTDAELETIARATGYPLHFLTHGPDYEALSYQALTAVVTEQKVMITRLTEAVTVLIDAMTPAPPPRATST